MKERTFKEWMHFFATINLGLFTILMLLVPAYPWWVFLILTFLSAFIGPNIFNSKNRGSHSNRSRF